MALITKSTLLDLCTCSFYIYTTSKLEKTCLDPVNHPTSLVLCIETMFVKLASKTSQMDITCDLVILTISSPQTFSYKLRHFLQAKEKFVSLKTPSNPEFLINLIFVPLLTLRMKLSFHSCVLPQNQSQSTFTSFRSKPNTYYTSGTPF